MSIFEQVSAEISSSLERIFEKVPRYRRLFNFLLKPERIISFKIGWIDRNNELQWNTGYRVQFNNALGPYKGGLRFHSTVTEDVLKALALEQTFKNALTGLNMGGGKGGSDFDPIGKTEGEIRNFCQAFMRELYQYIGADIDVPAGDIGVGAREIGYMYGEYRKLTHEFTGALTGKGPNWGGSLLRPEATGYGCVYFLENMLKHRNDVLVGKRVIVTGSGNVATFCMEKLLQLGAIVVAFNDVSGCVTFIDREKGMQKAHLVLVKKLYQERKLISEFATVEDCIYVPKDECAKPWYLPNIECDIVMPCATQNEVDEKDAQHLADIGCQYIAEGSNMSSTNDAIRCFVQNHVFFGPSKACNAGGVSVSGLEMAQNSSRIKWSAEEVDAKLKEIMTGIFNNSMEAGLLYEQPSDSPHEVLLVGANVAGFLKVAHAMEDQGMFF